MNKSENNNNNNGNTYFDSKRRDSWLFSCLAVSNQFNHIISFLSNKTNNHLKRVQVSKRAARVIPKDEFKDRYRKPSVDRQGDKFLLDNIYMLKAFHYCRKELDLTKASTEKFLKF